MDIMMTNPYENELNLFAERRAHAIDLMSLTKEDYIKLAIDGGFDQATIEAKYEGMLFCSLAAMASSAEELSKLKPNLSWLRIWLETYNTNFTFYKEN